MKSEIPDTPVCPRWLHGLAVLTALLTLPLLFLGAGVTSHGVGMIDPQGFRPPWEIVSDLIDKSGLPFRLEYGHRTFGFLVGFCGIGLAVGCWFFDRRPWMGWIGFLALAMICVQGLLGRNRVDDNALNGRTYAMIHGIFAQFVFATLVSVAVLTSRRWLAERKESASPALRRWSIITALVVFCQLVLGGVVRHSDSPLGPRGHLLGAFLVVGAVVWLLKLMRESESAERFRSARISLMLYLTLQLLLGMESWLARFFVATADLPQLAPVPMHAEWVRTGHYVMGSLIFASSVAVALLAQRKPALAAEEAPLPSRQLEGAL